VNDSAKKPKPVTFCNACGVVGYVATSVQRCGLTFQSVGGSRRCKGGIITAIQITDWEECPSCFALETEQPCAECRGAGWIPVRDKAWLRKEIQERRAKRKEGGQQ
jgi:hypothetical protein